MSHIIYKVETEVEDDGRWIAEVVDLPGVMAYGATENEAVASAQALALRVLADKIEAQKEPTETVTVSIEATSAEPSTSSDRHPTEWYVFVDVTESGQKAAIDPEASRSTQFKEPRIVKSLTTL